MKTLFLSFSAGMLMMAANPAAARDAVANEQQAAGDRIVAGKNVGIDARLANLETRLQDGLSSGAIAGTDARLLRKEIASLDQLAETYKSDGLSAQEQTYLRYRIGLARDRLQQADGSNAYATWRDRGRAGASG